MNLQEHKNYLQTFIDSPELKYQPLAGGVVQVVQENGDTIKIGDNYIETKDIDGIVKSEEKLSAASLIMRMKGIKPLAKYMLPSSKEEEFQMQTAYEHVFPLEIDSMVVQILQKVVDKNN